MAKGGCASTLIKVIAIGFAILIAVGLLTAMRDRREADPNPRPAVIPASPVPERLEPGDYGIFMLPGGSGVWMATTEADWDSLIEAENAASSGKPGAGALLLRLAESGRARRYANGTNVLVIKKAFTSLFVQVVDGVDAGRSGWIQVEFVGRRPKPATPDPDLERKQAAEASAIRVEKGRIRDEAEARVKEASAATEKAITDKKQSDRATSLLMTGKNLEKSGKPKPALENYRKIVAEFGESPSAKEAKERIKALEGK